MAADSVRAQAEAFGSAHRGTKEDGMRIAIAVVTVGRAEILKRTARLMLDQSRPPDRFVVAAVSPRDVEGLAEVDPRIEITFSPQPSTTVQRNIAIDAVAGDCDVVVFFDDDFAPSKHFLARLERLFAAHPEIAGATGHVAADGIKTPGIGFEEASKRVQEIDARSPPNTAAEQRFWRVNHLYGCNMALRADAAQKVRFDDLLPFYAWQEDRDFSVRMRAHGLVVRAPALTGVHMGVKGGRTSGLRLGYSQVANPLYFLRKGTMGLVEAMLLIGRNLTANLFRSLLLPEPWADRPGRVRGNFLALLDAARGRVSPERVIELTPPRSGTA